MLPNFGNVTPFQKNRTQARLFFTRGRVYRSSEDTQDSSAFVLLVRVTPVLATCDIDYRGDMDGRQMNERDFVHPLHVQVHPNGGLYISDSA